MYLLAWTAPFGWRATAGWHWHWPSTSDRIITTILRILCICSILIDFNWFWYLLQVYNSRRSIAVRTKRTSHIVATGGSQRRAIVGWMCRMNWSIDYHLENIRSSHYFDRSLEWNICQTLTIAPDNNVAGLQTCCTSRPTFSSSLYIAPVLASNF